jgi:hypothetical protein
MMVCGHGDVAEFCETRNMLVCEQYSGDLTNYRGDSHVLVTSQDMTEIEYYLFKGKLMRRGVELISTRYEDDPRMIKLLMCQMVDSKRSYGGRQMFGYRRKNGEIVPVEGSLDVVRRILEMRDKGFTLRQIREDEGVHHPDGKKLSISTIQLIIKNREKYEER